LNRSRDQVVADLQTARAAELEGLSHQRLQRPHAFEQKRQVCPIAPSPASLTPREAQVSSGHSVQQPTHTRACRTFFSPRLSEVVSTERARLSDRSCVTPQGLSIRSRAGGNTLRDKARVILFARRHGVNQDIDEETSHQRTFYTTRSGTRRTRTSNGASPNPRHYRCRLLLLMLRQRASCRPPMVEDCPYDWFLRAANRASTASRSQVP
jgi:hypothetical protein